MLIETTLHVHKSILNKLDAGAEISRRTRTSIIKMLIQRIMKDNKRMIKTYSRVRYQERDIQENWSTINIVLNEYEYEYWQDLRKFFKMSVSFVLAYAVLRYLDEVLEMSKNTDNYCFKNYIFVMKTINGTVCWQLYWGIPIKLNNLIYR
jgi:hypothetical protein